jgi:23S rRNA (cytosine1962-C5)-methyltransferase
MADKGLHPAARPWAAPVHRLRLADRRRHRCQRGHLWVYRSDLEPGQEVPDGEPVVVEHPRGGVVGTGLASARSQIAVRLLARGEVAVDDGLLRDRLRAAIARRAGGRPCHRLVWSEGDLLPGLIVDRYHDRLVVQATTAGMDRRLGLLVGLLRELTGCAQVVERNDLPVRAHEGLEQRAGVLHGPADTGLDAVLGNARWRIDLLDPHKTGTYLDQQDAHERVAALVRPGMRVADVFSHLGGFGIHAALRGAQAVCVDQAAASVAGVRAAAESNGVADRITAVETDAFAWLRAEVRAKARYDVVVLDPPSFARNRDALPTALRGYTDLHRHALDLLGTGGVLATFTCSHHVDEAAFREAILDAAAASGRTLRLDGRFDQPADHPVLAAIPETEYLRGLRYTVIDGG